jgi:erythronate-4-phosphate dehydrogenase
MRILLDENIPLGRELFGRLGDVVTVTGSRIDAHFPGLADFDVLAIRSTMDVTPALVDAAPKVRAIATATIGTDHIDQAYIAQVNASRERPIEVISAPGSNAASVADYVLRAILELTGGDARPLSAMTLGVVGCGNCGSRVVHRAEGFGMRIVQYDPPRAEREPEFESADFDEVLAADFVTYHVPLIQAGQSEWPTRHMVDADVLARMRGDAWLFNASRGGVVDSDALIAALQSGDIAGAVLDVFEDEPEPVAELIALSRLATPHIAGYAIEAKRRGAVMIFEAICEVFGIFPMDTVPLLMRGFEPPHGQRLSFDVTGDAERDADEAVRIFLAATHDITATSDELKATLGSEDRGAMFGAMRKNYGRDCGRHEAACFTVSLATDLPGVAQRLAGFGTRVIDAGAHFVLEPAG